MLKVGDKLAHKLGRSRAQVWNLSTLSTERLSKNFEQSFLYRFQITDTTQKSSGFTQPKTAVFNQLLVYLYPLYTVPITNTKLIKKELYS